MCCVWSLKTCRVNENLPHKICDLKKLVYGRVIQPILKSLLGAAGKILCVVLKDVLFLNVI
jgi:hypothetical protein